jgi:hypothetical protein
MRNPFRVETTVNYRSPLPLAALQSESGPLYAPDIPNDCILDLIDETGVTTQRLYARMAFDSLPAAKARVQMREADEGTVLSVTYVMPFFKVLYHRFLQVFCTIWALGQLLGWLWVLRHGWSNVSPDWRPMLWFGTIVCAGFCLGALSQLPLRDHPSVLSVWLEKAGNLKRVELPGSPEPARQVQP